MADAFLAGGMGRAHRGLHGDPFAGGGDGFGPVRAGAHAEDGSGKIILLRDAKPGLAPGGGK
jgi:hypothetical protein